MANVDASPCLVADFLPRLVCSSLLWGYSDGGTFRQGGPVIPFDDELDWVTVNSSTLAALDLPPDLLWQGTGGGCSFFDDAGGREGSLDDPSPFLVFGGMAFVDLCSVVSQRPRQL